ncbi:HAD family hydrolase [Streptomyces sp. NPDC002466]|uniref:HAD family hydrolase n=1 Tax=unclassified Streptomyces TaxID=2593676 RepID=UPI0035D90B96
MTHDDRLPDVLSNAQVVFFDFDGPVCDVFAGLPAPQVAEQLTLILMAKNAAAGAKAAETDDPIQILHIAHEADAELGRVVEEKLTEAEVEAVAVAGPPTSGAVEALQAVNASGKAVAVVSNNSAECVESFLKVHGLERYVARVVGRPTGQPHLMKPNPFPLITAAERMHIDVTNCTLIGDSLTDIQAAHTAGATVIAYANKPHKADLFTEAQADAITDEMQAIADALTTA